VRAKEQSGPSGPLFFCVRISYEREDPSNKPLDVETQSGSLREISFVDVIATANGATWRSS
jgi:hypothetical protein